MKKLHIVHPNGTIQVVTPTAAFDGNWALLATHIIRNRTGFKFFVQ